MDKRYTGQLRLNFHEGNLSEKIEKKESVRLQVDFSVPETQCPICKEYIEPGFLFRIIKNGVLENTICPKCKIDTITSLPDKLRNNIV